MIRNKWDLMTIRNRARRIRFERDHPNAIPMKQARIQVMEQFNCGHAYAHRLIQEGRVPFKITRLNPRVVYVEAIGP